MELVNSYDQSGARAIFAIVHVLLFRDVNDALTTLGQSWHMRFTLVALILVSLAACDTPGPHFRGLPATTVTVDGSTFDVRVNGRLAEALRTNFEYAPRFGPIRDRAATAMEKVSGCKVKEVRGDAALATGILDCGKGGPAPDRLRPQGEYDCLTLDSYISPATNELVLDLDCELI